MDCFGTCFTHAQTCGNVPVQSATQWTASAHALHMPKPVITFLFKVLRNGLLRHMLYTCFKPLITFLFKCATQWTASAHALHMPQPAKRSCSKCYAMDCFGTCFTHAVPVITFLFKVLRNGLLRHIPELPTRPKTKLPVQKQSSHPSRRPLGHIKFKSGSFVFGLAALFSICPKQSANSIFWLPACFSVFYIFGRKHK